MSELNVPPMSPEWEKAVRQAADIAAFKMRGRYESTMMALDAQHASDEPAYWTKTFPCPPWCATSNSHRSSHEPDERVHDGDVYVVSFETMEPTTAWGDFRAPEMGVQLTAGYRDVEPRVYFGSGDDEVAHATLAEAEQLAHHLLALVAKARGGWKPAPAPFDDHGRCEDRACRHCWTEQGEIVEASA